VGIIQILCSDNFILEHSFCINITRLLEVIPCILVDTCHNLEGTCYLCVQTKSEDNIPPLANLRLQNLSLNILFFALSHGFGSDYRYFYLIFIFNDFSSLHHNFYSKL